MFHAIILYNFLGKLMNQTWENSEEPSFRPSFGPNLGLHYFFSSVLPLRDVRHCCKLLLYAISRKTNETNIRKCKKKLILGTIFACLAKIWIPKFFFISVSSSGCLSLWQAIIVCNFKENQSSKLKKNGKKPHHFGPNLSPLGPNLGCQFFLKKSGFISHYTS